MDKIAVSDAKGKLERWKLELELSKKEFSPWVDRSKKIVEIYRDDEKSTHTNARSFNILWSNVQILMPATYSRTPKAEVERRYKDADTAGRGASIILERCLNYELEQYEDFDSVIHQCILDRNLSGRGVAWVRYEREEVIEASDDLTNSEIIGDLDESGEVMMPEPETVDRAIVEYVHWEDFRCSPARTWEEVKWVARRVYMTRDEGVDRFKEAFSDVPLNYSPVGLSEEQENRETSAGEELKCAQVWEIWDKPSGEVIFIADGHNEILESKQDPYGLEGFFPCPKPLFSTLTNDSLIPVPDYVLYQDQAEEVNLMTTKIIQLGKALAVKGVYDSSQTGIARLLLADDNDMIPIENWSAFQESGGANGSMDFMPIDQLVKALTALYASREQAKQTIYEITGISDILRGATKASETATAQNIKRQFSSLRLTMRQKQVATFASEILRIKAQLMMDFYAAQQLADMSGIENTPDAEGINEALALMKSEPLRSYRISVASDTLVEVDQDEEQERRMEFIGAAGSFLEQAMPMIDNHPQLLPLAAEMLMFGVRGMKGGRDIEAVFESTMSDIRERVEQQQGQEEQPDPQIQIEQQKLQQQMELEQAKLQMQQQTDQARIQADVQIKQAQAQMQAQLESERAQRQMEVDQNRAQMQMQQNAQIEQQKLEFERWKVELEMATRIQIANISSKAKVENAATTTATNEIATEIRQ